jgi:hypothetical protein
MRLLPALLLGIVLLVPSATVVVLDVGFGGTTHGHSERTAFALATGSPPVFLATPTDPTPGDSGVPIGFSVVVRDVDDDNLNVTWDWGDGTFDTNLTAPAASLQFPQQFHTYNATPLPGHDGEIVSFTLNISLDDGNGNIVWDLTTVDINRPPDNGPTIIGISVSPSGTKIRVNPGDQVTIVANASDPEGDPLTWTFKFNDSISVYDVVVDHTGSTAPGAIVWSNVSCAFSAIGSYLVLLNLTDAVPPYDVWPRNVSEHLDIEVVANVAPQTGGSFAPDPSNPLVSSDTGYVLVNYSIGAADADGDIINVTWVFDDGSPPVDQTSPGGTDGLFTFTLWRNYTNAGFINVSVTITDGIPGHETSLSAFLQVNSTNRPPSLSIQFNVSMGSYALKNELLNFTLNFTDPERNPIEVTIDFGDNSSRLYFNLTDFVGNNVTLIVNHSYANFGNYTMQIWYTDNKTGLFNHHKMTNITIRIAAPIVKASDIWSWWDYTSLGLVCMIPVLVVIRFVQMSRRRRFIEDQGMTYDEWKLMKSVKAEESLRQTEGGP